MSKFKEFAKQNSFLLITFLSIFVIVGVIMLVSSGSEPTLAGTAVPVKSRNHVAHGTLPKLADPPSSGDHYGDGVAGAGIHETPVEDGYMIHSLEHGAVVLNYDPNQLNPDEINKLKDLFNNKFVGKKIIMPRPGMSAPIIMVSWGYELKLKTIDEASMINFMQTNNDHGPEKEEMF